MDTNTLKSEYIYEETSALGQDVQIAGGTSDDEATESTEQDTLDKVSIEHGEPGQILFYL
jgi:hypothetical protein